MGWGTEVSPYEDEVGGMRIVCKAELDRARWLWSLTVVSQAVVVAPGPHYRKLRMSEDNPICVRRSRRRAKRKFRFVAGKEEASGQ